MEKSIEVAVNDYDSGQVLQHDFNVNYAGRANDLIRDAVVLKLEIKAL